MSESSSSTGSHEQNADANGPAGTADRRPVSDAGKNGETLDIALMCTSAIAAVLVSTQIGGLGHRERERVPWHLTTARVNPLVPRRDLGGKLLRGRYTSDRRLGGRDCLLAEQRL
jgi:hypothetical protein